MTPAVTIYDRNTPIAPDEDPEPESEFAPETPSDLQSDDDGNGDDDIGRHADADVDDEVDPGPEVEGDASLSEPAAASADVEAGDDGEPVDEAPEFDPLIGDRPEVEVEIATPAPGNSWTVKLLALPLLALLAVPTIFLGLGRTSLWEPDEPRFAESSRQMLASGDYWTPYFNGGTTFEDPVLFHWLQTAAFRRFGTSEYTARMPAGLAGLGCLFLVYLIGFRLFSARAGLLAAVALATTFRFVISSRTGLPDIVLLFFTLTALYGFLRAADSRPPGSWYALLGWLAVALGVLTKGLFGLWALAIWIPALVLSGRFGGLRRMRFSSGVLLAVAVAAPWYLYMSWTHGRDFVESALLSEFLARYASAPTDASGPLVYLAAWPADAMPWTLYVAAAVASVVFGWGQLSPDQRRGAALCVVWFTVVMALGGLSAALPSQALLPLYPAGALLVGMLFDRAVAAPDDAGLWTGFANWLTALALLAASGLCAWGLQRMFGTPLLSPAMALPAALALGGVFMAIFQRGRRPLWAFGVVAPVFALGYGLLAAEIAPRELEPFKPVKPLAELAAAQPGDDRQIAVFGERRSGVVFYGGQNVEWLDSATTVAAFLSESGVRLCILSADDLEDVRSRYAGTLYRLASEEQLDLRPADILGGGR